MTSSGGACWGANTDVEDKLYRLLYTPLKLSMKVRKKF
jgi:hypothetical protein